MEKKSGFFPDKRDPKLIRLPILQNRVRLEERGETVYQMLFDKERPNQVNVCVYRNEEGIFLV